MTKGHPFWEIGGIERNQGSHNLSFPHLTRIVLIFKLIHNPDSHRITHLDDFSANPAHKKFKNG